MGLGARTHHMQTARLPLSNASSSALAPAVLDAWFETAWALPRCRLTWLRVMPQGQGQWHVLVSAGQESPPFEPGQRLNLGAGALEHAVMRHRDAIVIEDVHTDRRSVAQAASLLELQCASLLVRPIPSLTYPTVRSALLLDAPTPRTWGAREHDITASLQPLLALQFDQLLLLEENERLQAVLAARGAA